MGFNTFKDQLFFNSIIENYEQIIVFRVEKHVNCFDRKHMYIKD